MPPILSCRELSITFGAQPLFRSLSLTVDEGDRMGIIGPNGAGKSTLLKIMAGLIAPDSGERSVRKLARAGYVAQDSLFPPGKSVFHWVREPLDQEPGEPVEKDTRAAMALSQAGFTQFEADASSLSGGWRKRLAIMQEVVRQPDILLLDEPTNHLDLEGIAWLEKLLTGAAFAFVAVSHDRYFLENACTSLAEVNRAYPEGIFRVPGNYSVFLEKRDEFLTAQAKHEEGLATQVRREIEWLRRGAKARTTKSKARIGKAYELMDELESVTSRNRSLEPRAGIEFQASGRQTKKLVEARGLTKTLGGKHLFSGLEMTLKPGMRIGLVGPNGSGKTTLLRIIAGEMEADGGTIERAEHLQIVYFDQNRDRLNPGDSLRKALAPEGDMVAYRGQSMHVNAWARRFLFRTEQLEVPVSQLSGGERARVLIARLMTREADLLLLDEPTNDLDIPTLEVLEESLSTFSGALVLVTHDRYLLDRVSTAVMGLDGEGGATLYADYSQWEADLAEQRAVKPAEAKPVAAEVRETGPAAGTKKKLSYNEQREWDAMEGRILEAEARLEEAQERVQAPDVVADGEKLQTAYKQLQQAQEEVEQLYARWAELEGKLK